MGNDMKDKKARFTFRVDYLLLEKLHYVSEAEGRTANKELEWLVRQHIEEYEKQHGEIETNLK